VLKVRRCTRTTEHSGIMIFWEAVSSVEQDASIHRGWQGSKKIRPNCSILCNSWTRAWAVFPMLQDSIKRDEPLCGALTKSDIMRSWQNRAGK
jgi:hypothetical protein